MSSSRDELGKTWLEPNHSYGPFINNVDNNRGGEVSLMSMLLHIILSSKLINEGGGRDVKNHPNSVNVVCELTPSLMSSKILVVKIIAVSRPQANLSRGITKNGFLVSKLSQKSGISYGILKNGISIITFTPVIQSPW